MLRPKIVVVNDTAYHNPRTGHAGCILVMRELHRLCAENELEVIGTIPVGKDPLHADYKPLLMKADLVIVNGEGTIHHDRLVGKQLLRVGQHYPAVLINSVLQEMDPKLLGGTLDWFKLLSFRESMSYSASLPYIGSQPTFLVPDLSFAGIEVVRNSGVQSMLQRGIGVTDSVSNGRAGFPINVGLRGYLMQLRGYSSLVCGRFHAVCLAAMLGIPFSAYPSNTHKIRGIMRDMGIEHLYATDVQSALTIYPETLAESVTQYVAEAPKKIDDMFSKIREIAYGEG
jgi:hypothetical protein